MMEETDLHFLLCGVSESWDEVLFQPLAKLLHNYKATQWVEIGIQTNLKRFLNQQPLYLPIPWVRSAFVSQSDIS